MPERLNNRFNKGLNYGAEPAVYPDEAPAKGWTDGQDADVVLLRDRLRDLDRRTLERLDPLRQPAPQHPPAGGARHGGGGSSQPGP